MMGRKFLVSCLLIFCFVPLAHAEVGRDEIQRSLADSLVAAGDRARGLVEYQKILARSPSDMKTRTAVADLLSWDRRYAEALKLYDEVLLKDRDAKVWRQKARVLGWSRAYGLSLKEYEAILQAGHDPAVDLEMRAKKALWASHVDKAIVLNGQLIALEPENVEAAFDLGEIYASLGLWPEAREAYEKVLKASPAHDRAKRSLEKVKAQGQVALTSGYGFEEADSGSRDSDVRRHSFSNNVDIPVEDRLLVQVGNELGWRSFADHPRTEEKIFKLKGVYRSSAWWSADAAYDLVDYSHDFRTMHEFSAGANVKAFDLIDTRWSVERARLENNSQVLDGHYYQDQYALRAKIPVGMRFEAGVDHVYARYSDSNKEYVSGGDMLYRLFFDPNEVYVKYRYERQDFLRTEVLYFSPRRFSVQTLGLFWRHSFNQEEKFFGGNRKYIECGYDVSADSEHVASQKLTGAGVYEFSLRSSLRLEFEQTRAENDVYRDQRYLLSLRHSF